MGLKTQYDSQSQGRGFPSRTVGSKLVTAFAFIAQPGRRQQLYKPTHTVYTALQGHLDLDVPNPNRGFWGYAEA